MMSEKQLQQRALELGFFPVDLDFPESGWQIIEQHEGSRPSPALWLRHVPNVGDEIVFRPNSQYFRGRVAKRAFEASAGEIFQQDHEAEFLNFCLSVHLWIDQITPCPHPAEGSIWEVEE